MQLGMEKEKDRYHHSIMIEGGFHVAENRSLPIRLQKTYGRGTRRLDGPRHRHHAHRDIRMAESEDAQFDVDYELGNPTRQRQPRLIRPLAYAWVTIEQQEDSLR